MRLYRILVTILLHLTVFTQATQNNSDTPGKWTPTDHIEYREWLLNLTEHTDKDTIELLHPVLQDFNTLVTTTPRIRMLFQSMFDEIPHTEKYDLDRAGDPTIRSFPHLLRVLNYIIQTAPAYNERKNRMGMAGVPILAAFSWPVYTRSGMSAFLEPDVNSMIQRILNIWGEYLQSPESKYVLGTSETGWLGPDAVRNVENVANIGQTNYTFHELFVSDAREPYHGFMSWDDYFVRRFREGIRPVEAPYDPNVITNACESNPYRLQYNVQAYDEFWMKGRRYSIADMFGTEGAYLVDRFVGGTVYQGYLDTLSYHRWHAPVSGRIVKSYIINGTYLARPDFLSFEYQEKAAKVSNGTGLDSLDSQPFDTSMNTRAVIVIEADNPAIGLMAFIGVGMTEVSTCEITVQQGEYVNKGDQIGMFHYGGSTHCLVFGGGVDVSGFPEKQEYNVPVKGKLAIVKQTHPNV